MILFVSPRDVEFGCVVVDKVGWEVLRRSVKSATCARARGDERVPMRRVRGVEAEAEAESVKGWLALARGTSACIRCG